MTTAAFKPSRQRLVEAEILSQLAQTAHALSGRDLFPLCQSAEGDVDIYRALGALAKAGQIICVGMRQIKGAKDAKLYRPAQEVEAMAAMGTLGPDEADRLADALEADLSIDSAFPDAIDASAPRRPRDPELTAPSEPATPPPPLNKCQTLLSLEPGMVPSGIRWCRFDPSGERQNDELMLNVEDDGAGPYLVLSFDRGDEFIFETPNGLQSLADIGRDLIDAHEAARQLA